MVFFCFFFSPPSGRSRGVALSRKGFGADLRQNCAFFLCLFLTLGGYPRWVKGFCLFPSCAQFRIVLYCFVVRRGGAFRFASVASFLRWGCFPCCFSGLFFVRLFRGFLACGGGCCFSLLLAWWSRFSAVLFPFGFRCCRSSLVLSPSSVCSPVFAPSSVRSCSVASVVRRGFLAPVGGGCRRRRRGSAVAVGAASVGFVSLLRLSPVGSPWSARRRLFRLLSSVGRACCCSRGCCCRASALVAAGRRSFRRLRAALVAANAATIKRPKTKKAKKGDYKKCSILNTITENICHIHIGAITLRRGARSSITEDTTQHIPSMSIITISQAKTDICHMGCIHPNRFQAVG